MTLTFAWRLAGPNPMLPLAEPLPVRLAVVFANALALPTVLLVPLMVYARIRHRWADSPVGSAEYMIVLVVASIIGAAIFNFALRFEPTVNRILSDPRLIDTAIRLFMPLWVINAMLGTVFARIQKQSDTAQEALQTVETQRRLLLESEERVRGQVASYLHDRVQTDLVSIGLRIRAAVSPGPEEIVSDVDGALAELERVRADEVRSASRQLSPNLAHVTLDTALRELARAYQPGMKVTVAMSDPAAQRLRHEEDLTRATGIYRICEQGLLNSAIHGHATDCSIHISLGNRDTYVLELRDNGVGLPADPVVPGMGSTVISAWVETLQGEWSLKPASVGMTLTATIPTA